MLLLLRGAVCCLSLCVVIWVIGVCRIRVLFVDAGGWCCPLLIDGCGSLLCVIRRCCVLAVACSVSLLCFVVGCFVLFVYSCCRVLLFVAVLCVGDCVIFVVCLLLGAVGC